MVAVTASGVEVLPAEPVDECGRLEALCSALSVENEHLWDEVFRLTGENERLRGRVGKLEGSLEEARRAGKRQAAPFSRGEPKSAPRRPGRRSGEEHGRHGHRQPPGEVDEQCDAPLAGRCECGGEIVEDRIEYQFQDELPEPQPIRRRFAVHIGKCRGCGRRHQGRHPFQTSDALGAAACMLGPRAVALASELNKELGLSPQKTAKALARFGIQVSAGGVVQAMAGADEVDAGPTSVKPTVFSPNASGGRRAVWSLRGRGPGGGPARRWCVRPAEALNGYTRKRRIRRAVRGCCQVAGSADPFV